MTADPAELLAAITDEAVDTDLLLDGFRTDERYPEHGHDALRTAYRSGFETGAVAAQVEARRELSTLRGDLGHLLSPVAGALRWSVNKGTEISMADLESHVVRIFRALDTLDAALGEQPLRDQLAAAQNHPLPVGPDAIEAGADRADGRTYTWRAHPVIHS